MAQKVYIVTGQHQSNPVVKMSVHTTQAGATKRAASLVASMAKSGNSRAEVDEQNWEGVLEYLQEVFGAMNVNVEIDESELED